MSFVIDTLLPYFLSVVTVTVMWLAGNKDRRAWILGIIAQGFWLVFIVNTKSWGLAPLTVAMVVTYTRNLRAWTTAMDPVPVVGIGATPPRIIDALGFILPPDAAVVEAERLAADLLERYPEIAAAGDSDFVVADDIPLEDQLREIMSQPVVDPDDPSTPVVAEDEPSARQRMLQARAAAEAKNTPQP